MLSLNNNLMFSHNNRPMYNLLKEHQFSLHNRDIRDPRLLRKRKRRKNQYDVTLPGRSRKIRQASRSTIFQLLLAVQVLRHRHHRR